MPDLICAACTQRFKADRYGRKYCSKACKNQSQVGKSLPHKGVARPDLARAAIRDCVVCAKSFRAVKDFMDRKQRFCSKQCWASRAVLTQKKCRGCDQIVCKGKTYCSKSCSVKDMVGPKSPAYIDGKAAERNTFRKENSALAKWRVLVFERDGYTCQHCAQKGGTLHAHHVLAYATYPDLRLELSNGLTLCVVCHSIVHGRWLGKKSSKDPRYVDVHVRRFVQFMRDNQRRFTITRNGEELTEAQLSEYVDAAAA